MLSIIYSDWYYGVGKLYKSDGKPYRTAHGAFRNHPCTQWAAANQYNLAWLIRHGYALCHEYNLRYGKVHTCLDVISQAERIFHTSFPDDFLSLASRKVTSFTRAMPEYLKFDTTIDTITAYKRYLNTKPWLATNYLRIPSRKPSFITTMTTTPNKSELPIYDFSTTPEQRAEEQAKMDAAIQVAQLEASLKKQEAPVVKSMKAKAKGIVPTKKATPKATKKAGRVVGISADENKFLYELLQAVLYDNNYATMISDSQIAFDKLIARYNNK
tara:strand:+ start:568 stop:1380 length:813 start_codon:yes stop_codon:yes gene_type:complete